MPGARSRALVTLSELPSIGPRQPTFAKLGVNLRLAVNIPVNALVKLKVAEIVQTYRAAIREVAGLIIDVTEEQIVTDLALANEMTKELQHLNVYLAIDDFGRGYSSLPGLKELPFAELKLDRAFVTDCGTDKVNAPVCKTVIDLAHNFGSIAVGDRHREGVRRDRTGEHGLRLRPGLSARPADAGGALYFAAAPARRLAGPAVRRAARRRREHRAETA